MIAQWAIWILLWIGVAASIVTALGVLLAHDVFDRLHYLGPVASVGTVCIAAAVVTQEATSQAGIKAILIAIVIVFMNPVLTHATARAARVRRYGKLMPDPEDRVPFLDRPGYVGQGEPDRTV